MTEETDTRERRAEQKTQEDGKNEKPGPGGAPRTEAGERGRRVLVHIIVYVWGNHPDVSGSRVHIHSWRWLLCVRAMIVLLVVGLLLGASAFARAAACLPAEGIVVQGASFTGDSVVVETYTLGSVAEMRFESRAFGTTVQLLYCAEIYGVGARRWSIDNKNYNYSYTCCMRSRHIRAVDALTVDAALHAGRVALTVFLDALRLAAVAAEFIDWAPGSLVTCTGRLRQS